jgi:endonuclease/exonuclease/phosphatase family metal-dependent hydrolase
VDITGPVPFRLLAVWTLAEHGYARSLAADLDTLAASGHEGPLVLAGDFNSNSIWDGPRRAFDHGRLVRRLENEFGLVSAYHARHQMAHGAERHATHFFLRDRDRPFHLDYCFVPREWVAGIRRVTVRHHARWEALSDHRPLVVDWR